MCGFKTCFFGPVTNSLDRLAMPEYIWSVRAKVIEMTPDDVFRLRRKVGMNQQQFADLVGVRMMTVSRWERGATKVSHAYSTTIRTLVDEYKRKQK